MKNNQQKHLAKTLLIIFLCGFLSACLKRGDNPNDPYEAYNRKAYKFNEKIDNAIVKPVAKAYEKVLPWPIRKGVTNFFSNLGEVRTIVNDVLQWNWKFTLKDSTRLFINTTIGVGGIFDFASEMSLPKHYNDFGLTFAKWGDPDSPYLQMPFLGPSTIRDSFALTYDYVLSPYPYLIEDRFVPVGLLALNLVNQRANLLEAETLIEEAALDPYAFQRDAYLQNRKYLMNINAGIETDPYVEGDDSHLGDPLADVNGNAEETTDAEKTDAEKTDAKKTKDGDKTSSEKAAQKTDKKPQKSDTNSDKQTSQQQTKKETQPNHQVSL